MAEEEDLIKNSGDATDKEPCLLVSFTTLKPFEVPDRDMVSKLHRYY